MQTAMEQRPKKLLDRLREVIRRKHYSTQTEDTSVFWVKRYILFHNKQHPLEMGNTEIETFLTHLAVDQKVAASTQNQALRALLFLYRHVLRKDVDLPIDALHAQRPTRLPTVLTQEEVHQVIKHLSGTSQLMANMLYGSGLRVMECVRFRVKDRDVAQRLILVRDGKGMEDRVTMLPASLITPLQEHVQHVQRLHEKDLARGWGSVYLPFALERKYPNAHKEWIWQYVFPSTRLSKDPHTGVVRRYSMRESSLQKAVRKASRGAGVNKHVSCHTCRHSFATHLLHNGYDIRTVQELLGHKDVKTTMISTHVLNRGRLAVRSPLDEMPIEPRQMIE
jgi:integron integrase